MFKKLIMMPVMAILILAHTPVALAEESAKAHIDSLGREAIETLTGGSLSESAQRAKFLDLLDRGFDVPAIAKYVMGKYWKTLSPDQQSHFVQSFRDDLSRQYANRFKEYRGVDFHIKGAREIGDGGYFVQSSLKKPSEAAKTEVEWKVYDSKILDVKVEGVSMSQTKRDETYAAIAAAGGDPIRYVMGGGGSSSSAAPSSASRTASDSDED